MVKQKRAKKKVKAKAMPKVKRKGSKKVTVKTNQVVTVPIKNVAKKEFEKNLTMRLDIITQKNRKIDELKETNKIVTDDTTFKIVTDFDKVLYEVNKARSIDASVLRKRLRMDKKLFEQCYEILLQNKLLLIDFPVVGKVRLKSLSYKEDKLRERKERKEKYKQDKEEKHDKKKHDKKEKIDDKEISDKNVL